MKIKIYNLNGILFFEGEGEEEIGACLRKGKEYSEDGILIFEGEYLNGKCWNGKGKGYINNSEFEGEYLNGNWWNGIIRIYYNNGILAYECEFKNGENNGNGKEHNWNGILIFEGEYLKGKRWNGKFYDFESNIEYEIKNGSGYGKEYNINGQVMYEGEYLNGKKWNGKGKEKNLKKNLILEFVIENGIVKEKNYNPN